MHRYAKNGLAGIGLLALMFMLGCDKLTFERFNTIRQGDSRESVEATLGPPTTRISDMSRWARPRRQIEVFIRFDENGNVRSKNWVDPEHQHVEDIGGSPHGDGDSMTNTSIRQHSNR